VVRAGALEAAAVLAGAVLGVLAVEEPPPEEQAASVALSDRAHRIPATDRVFRFIFGPSYLVGIAFR
jgi:hypothetical protein